MFAETILKIPGLAIFGVIVVKFKLSLNQILAIIVELIGWKKGWRILKKRKSDLRKLQEK